jgi:excisionase family DNA binding protein
MDENLALEILERLNKIETLLLAQAPDRPLTVPQAAAYLSVSVSHLYKLIHESAIRCSKPNGKQVYFTREALNEYLARNPKRTAAEIENEAVAFIAAGAGRKG